MKSAPAPAWNGARAAREQAEHKRERHGDRHDNDIYINRFRFIIFIMVLFYRSIMFSGP
jgi:hypothetical protein